jgi:hypothetical protein
MSPVYSASMMRDYAEQAVREAQQEPVTDEENRLQKALVYVAHALHATPQHMLAKGITLVDGDTVRVSLDGWTVEASNKATPQPAQQKGTINGRAVKVDWKAQALELRELVRLGGFKVAELEAALAAVLAQQGSSLTSGMNIAQRILHVGGRNNAAGYIEFGSIHAVDALVQHVLRDLPDPVHEYRKGFIAGQLDMRDRPEEQPQQEPVGDWAIDYSAGRPILTYNNCSVIEAETAVYVLNLIKSDTQPAPVREDWGPGPHELHSLPAQQEPVLSAGQITPAMVQPFTQEERNEFEKVLKTHMKPAQHKPENNCIECANADSLGLPDKVCCKRCYSGGNWSPLNRSSVNLNKQPPGGN